MTATPALCACGRPNTHPGNCSARHKARASAQPISEAEMARRLFGDLADDILLLRARGHTVARFRDGFRVDRDVLSGDEMRTRAKALRGIFATDNAAAAGVATGPQDLAARMLQLEQRLEFLFAVVADAIHGRRETLTAQAAGLEKIEQTLRAEA